jgi:hypothetical protein
VNETQIDVVEDDKPVVEVKQLVIALDDDEDFADVVLETPTCTLGEECESCQ